MRRTRIGGMGVVCAILTLGAVGAAGQAEAKVIRIGPGGAASGCGDSWGKPCGLQEALALASNGDELWVKSGTYSPGTDRTSTFALRSGVALYGGFAGTETARAQRDWKGNVTTLSGDIGAPGSAADNAYHVTTGSGTDATAILDGFNVTAGNASGTGYPDAFGAGMINVGGSPTIANCTFSNNTAAGNGGGILNYGSSPSIAACTFSGNRAARGAGLYNYDRASPTVSGCTFSGNVAAGEGGGVINELGSNPTIVNSTFHQNSASIGGGLFNDGSSPRIVNCTISANRATDNGGGISNSNSSHPILRNVILWGNALQQVSGSDSGAIIQTAIVQGGCPAGSTCSGVRNVNPLLGSLGAYGGPTRTLLLQFGSPAVDAGNATVCASAPVSQASQNGLTRPQGTRCDLGAFELGQLQVTSAGGYDGWVRESVETSGLGGALNSGATTLYVGDDALNRQYRAVLSFDTGPLPNAAVLTASQLRLRHAGVSGTNPFGTHGSLTFDMRTGAYSGGNALQPADFQATASTAGAGTVPNRLSAGWYAATLGATARSRVNLRGVSQVRLRFATDDNNDGGADYLSLWSGNAASAYRPELRVWYYAP